MGELPNLSPPQLSQHALDALCRELIDAAEFMADEQILCVADALHDTLRHRKKLRCKIHQRVQERLSPSRQAGSPSDSRAPRASGSPAC